MRWVWLVGLVSLGCTRPNPAFDGSATDPSEGEVTGRPDTLGTADLDTTAGPITVGPDTTGPGTTGPDLPLEPACELQPSPGAIIQLGNPAMFGGGCPTQVDLWARVLSNDGAEVVLDGCTQEGCFMCEQGSDHPLSVSPLVVGDSLPVSTCLRVEARNFLHVAEERCHWGALSIHDPLLLTPFVIATARSSSPTPAAIDMLDGAIPDPEKALECECSEVGQATECCLAAVDPPSFWAYAIDGMTVYPGGEAPIELGLAGGLMHVFHVLQAEQIPSCDDPSLQLSWAVMAQQ